MPSGYGKDMTGSFRTHSDLPYAKGKRLLLDIYYTCDSSFTSTINVQLFQYRRDGDSILVLNKTAQKVKFKKGTRKIKVDFSTFNSNTSYNEKFLEILRRTESVAPGSYKLFITVKDTVQVFHSVSLYDVDSSLSPNSLARKDINKSLTPKSSTFFGGKGKVPLTSAGTALLNSKNKVEKEAKQHGLTSVQSERDGKSYVNLYYQDWFAGRYEAHSKQPLTDHLKQQDKLASTPNSQQTNNELGHPSLYSQQRTIDKQKGDQETYKGEIGLTTVLSTGQEQNSGINNNNYYELRGRTELPLGKIPVEVEGLYTSLDNHREVKSSYIRLHYDVDKIKDALKKNISSYNNKFSETQSKSVGMGQVYSSSIDNLQAQKAKLENEANAQKASDGNDPEKLQQLEDKQRKIEELDRKIEKYKTLLEQDRNTNYFDSAVAFSKTKDLNSRDLSYKQLARRSSDLLPDGKAKSFLAGITTMDAGMFPKNQSKYTMSGQMMKGADVGYDIGFCELGATAGKTQYAGRDGSLDQYTCYSARTTFKPVREQKVSLIYYGYSADRKFGSGNDFYKNVNISAPAFFQPVHIISGNYEGSISKYIVIGSEAATSMKQSDKTNVPAMSATERMAYHLNADGNIPNTSVSLEGAYDKTGKGFENNTLPLMLSGTEQYRAAGKTDLFHSFLTAGLEYDLLRQANFASKASNSRWGFLLKTNSKRYPNVYLSYKPFTTFHSFTDTLNVPQRPLIGSVFTGKLSYQVRRQQKTIRFQLLYNTNQTIIDTAKYGSRLMQWSTVYSDKKTIASLSIGQMEVLGTALPSPATMPNKTSFLSLMGNYNLNRNLSLSAGQDFGVAAFGLCRYAINGGFLYRFEKIPFTTRLNTRYNTYKLSETADWKNIYSGSIDIAYRFKMKKIKNNE
jgi:hypothetical protein